MSRPRCIVCGKPIAKKTSVVYFRNPQPATEETNLGIFGRALPAKEARPDGHREHNGYSTTVYLTERPRNRAEAQRYVNGEIISSSRYGEFLSNVGYWDGESYIDPYFHANACAIKQGYASAQHGDRYTWEKQR